MNTRLTAQGEDWVQTARRFIGACMHILPKVKDWGECIDEVYGLSWNPYLRELQPGLDWKSIPGTELRSWVVYVRDVDVFLSWLVERGAIEQEEVLEYQTLYALRLAGEMPNYDNWRGDE